MSTKTSRKKSDEKVILAMKMPENCGKCKFGMKTCNGNDFCFITRSTVSVDCKAKDCPLSEIPKSKKKPEPKKVPCKLCGCKKATEGVDTTNNSKFYICSKCGNDSSTLFGATWRAAKENWNIINS